MWNLLNPDNEFIKVINNITDMVLLSLLWILMCCTIVGIGPATVALYYAIVKSIRRDRGSTFKAFFHAIKENWKTSLLFGLLLGAFGVSIFIYDAPNIVAYFTLDNRPNVILIMISFLKLFILSGLFLYLFPLISRFEVTISGAVLTSLLLAIRHVLATIAMCIILLVGFFVISFAPFLLVIMPAAIVYAQSFLLEPIFKQVMSENNKTMDENEDQWYLE